MWRYEATASIYTQASAFLVQLFWNFGTIEKFSLSSNIPIDSNVKLPHISSFLYQENATFKI